MSWAKASIGDITEVVTKGTTPTTYGMPFTESGVNFIKAEALNGDCTLDREGFTFVDESTHETFKRSILRENDVLLTIAGAQVGRCGLVRSEHLPANTNQAVEIIRVVPSKADPRFIYYHFKNPRTFQMCQGMGGQAAQPNINLAVLKSFAISLPDLRTQNEVAETLSAYDDLIENNRRRIALLEEAARMLYREWFVHFRFPGHEHVKIIDGIPEGWGRRTLGDLVDVVNDTVKPANFAEDDIHIGLEHIPRRSFTLADWEPAVDWQAARPDFPRETSCSARSGLISTKLASLFGLVWRLPTRLSGASGIVKTGHSSSV